MFDDLIARLEAATRGSRELDAHIHCALHPDQKFLADPGDIIPPRPAAPLPTPEPEG